MKLSETKDNEAGEGVGMLNLRRMKLLPEGLDSRSLLEVRNW